MAHYEVHYSVGEKGEHAHPERVAGIVWKRLVYHGRDPVFIGETDDPVTADERHVVALQADRAATLVKQFEASRRPSAPSPEEAAPRPPQPPAGGRHAASAGSGGGPQRGEAKSPRRGGVKSPRPPRSR